MKITQYQEPFHFVYFENIYDESELSSIWQELEFLNCNNKLLPAEETESASVNGELLKNNSGIFLDSLYSRRNFSNILTVNRKLFTCGILQDSDSWYISNLNPNRDDTLISYYENGDYYKPHTDTAHLTACTWFYKEPKKFTGGDLWFPNHNIKVEVANNSGVIFPSIIPHAVDEIHIDINDRNKGLGRYCMTQFMTVVSERT